MTKRALKFGKYSTASDDWTLSALALTYPERRACNVELPYADGSIDLLESVSDEPRYSTRELTATLELSSGTRAERTAKLNALANAYHGRTVPITLPDDPDHWLSGRVHISVQCNDRAHAIVDIAATCQPWRTAWQSRTVEADLTSVSSILLPNSGGKRLVPSIEVVGTEDVTITLESDSWTLSPGTSVLPEIQIPSGGITYGLSGSGIVRFHYVEALL